MNLNNILRFLTFFTAGFFVVMSIRTVRYFRAARTFDPRYRPAVMTVVAEIVLAAAVCAASLSDLKIAYYLAPPAFLLGSYGRFRATSLEQRLNEQRRNWLGRERRMNAQDEFHRVDRPAP